MQALFSLLLFAAAFYFMMRFGCGAHMVHGHGDHRGHEAEGTTKDPVCGMNVAPAWATPRCTKSRQYRFCSKKCLDQFDAEPQRYSTSTGGMS